jgi:hypothetical protein
MSKRCPRCREVKEMHHYYISNYNAGGYDPYCIPCCSARAKEHADIRRNEPAKVILITKVCLMCNTEKSVDQFGKNVQRRDKYHSYCKPCWVSYVKAAQRKAKNLL